MQAIFDQASALPLEARARYLADSCSGNTEMRSEIEEMLESLDTANKFLHDPTVHPQAAHAKLDDIRCGMIIGRYKLLEKIGEGASANVYMAEQLQPVRRRVAFKIIKLGMDTAEVIARFDAEKQALAMMEHPNIAKVFDAGATGTGRPYFVLELVKGIPITEYCDKNQLTPHQRLELLIPVCQAVQHAHVKGVIHRDLKPSNILVTLHDGVPVPKVIDFGIAKATGFRLTDKTLFTKFHQFVGTPAYMSPEQAEMSGLDVDTRSDVYALGVLVYELITGSTPFDSRELLEAGVDAIREVIMNREPQKPSTRLSTLGQAGLVVVAQHRRLHPGELSDQVRGELDWIVMKALEKDRTRRYQGAADLGDDIRRFLDNEPVAAGPPDKVYRLKKFLLRHRRPALAACLIFVSLVAGLVVAMTAWQRAEREAAAARLQASRADTVSQLLYSMFESADPGKNQGTQYTVRQLLDDAGHKLERQLESEPEVEYSVRQVMARAYEGLGEYLESEFHWRRTVELSRKIFGNESPETAAVEVRLGWTLHEMGHHDKARSSIEQSLSKQEMLLGENHPSCLETRSYLVEVYRVIGDLSQAEKLAVATLEEFEKHPNDLGNRRQWLLQTLAQVYRDQGRTDQSEKIARELVSTTTEQQGAENPQTLRAIHTLSQSYLESGQLEIGEQLLAKGLETSRRTLGDEHPTTLELRSDLAAFCQARGDYERAGKIWEEVLTHRQELLGEDHADTLQTMLHLASLYYRTARVDAAEELTENAVTRSQSQLGNHHAVTLEAIESFVHLKIEQRRSSEAIPLLRLAWQKSMEDFGASHSVTLRLRLLLGDLILKSGNGREAHLIYAEVLALQEQQPDLHGSGVLKTQYRIGMSLFNQRRHLEAEHLLIDVLEQQTQLLGPSHADRVDAMALLGVIQLRRWSLDAARANLEEARGLLAVRAAQRPEDYAKAAKNHADCLYRLGHCDEALEKMLELTRTLPKLLGKDHPIISDTFSLISHVRLFQAKADSELKALLSDNKAYLAKYGESSSKYINNHEPLARAYIKTERFEEAKAAIGHMRQMGERHKPGSTYLEATRLYLEAFWEQSQGNDNAATKLFSEAVEFVYANPGLPRNRHRTAVALAMRHAETIGAFESSEKHLDALEDRKANLEWDTASTRVLLPRNTTWKYLYDRVEDPGNWLEHQFDDTAWRHGLAPLGHHLNQLGTYINTPNPERFRPVTAYFRANFEVASRDAIQSLKLRLRRDDGAVVYINGKEVVSDNMPATESITSNTPAESETPTNWQTISRIFLLEPDVLIEGTNQIAVELHQFEKPARESVFSLALEALVSKP